MGDLGGEANAGGDDGGGQHTSSLAIGIGLSLTSAAMNATGMNLQRLAGAASGGAEGEVTRSRRWLTCLGIFLSTSCGFVDASSYGFAPQSTLAPFGAGKRASSDQSVDWLCSQMPLLYGVLHF